MPAIPIVGGVIAAGGAIAGGAMAASGAKSAAKTSAKAADAAAKAQLEMFYQSREDQAPWREAGAWALEQLQAELAKGPPALDWKTYERSDWYQVPYQQGLNALKAMGAATGVSNLKSAMRFASGLAYDKYMQARAANLNEWLAGVLAPFQSLAGLGQSSALAMGQQAAQTGANLGQIYQTAASQIGSAYTARANALAQGLTGAMGAINTGIGNYMDYSMMNRMIDKLG